MISPKHFKTEFARNVIGLSLVTALSQAIPFLFLPILQRYFFSPEDFGIYSTFVSIASIWIAFASLKYEFAIVITETYEERLRLLALSLSFVIISAFAALLFGVLFPNIFSELFSLPLGIFYPLMLALSILGFAGTQVFNYWQNYAKKFGAIGISKLVQSLSGESIKGLTGLAGWNQTGLILGRAIGQIASFIWLAIKVLPGIWKDLNRECDKSSLLNTLKRNRDFVYFSTPSSLLGTFSNNLHILVPMQFYPTEIIGVIGASYIYLAVPSGIISGSFSQVFFKQISEIQQRKQLMKFYRGFVIRLFFAGLPFALLVQLIPQGWAANLLGLQWVDIIVYSKIMIWYVLAMFVSSSVSFIYIRLNCQKKMFVIDIFRTALNFSAIMIGHIMYNEPIMTILFFTISQIIAYLISIFAAVYFIKKSNLLQ